MGEKHQNHLFLETKGHCFFCFDKNPSSSKHVPAEVGRDLPDMNSSISAFHSAQSLHCLSHCLKLGLGQLMLKGSLEQLSGLRVVLCEECALLNGRFSELYRQLERIRMELESSLGDIAEKLIKGEGVGVKALDGLLSGEEAEFVEAVRRTETMKKCLIKMDGMINGSTLEGPIHSDEKYSRDMTLNSQIDCAVLGMISSPKTIPTNEEEQDYLQEQVENAKASSLSQKSWEEEESLLSQSANIHEASLPPQPHKELANLKEEENIAVEILKIYVDFGVKSATQINYQSVHVKPKNFTCDICGKKFSKKAKMKAHHGAIHVLNESQRCNQCKKQFFSKGDLRRHQNCVHLGIRPYKCNFCEKKFSLQSNRKRHHRSVHQK